MRRGPVRLRDTGATAAPVSYQPVEPTLDMAVSRWRDAGLALHQARRGGVLTPAAAEARIAQALTHATLVSFDVFDTLVTRACATPSDVFLFLALEAPFAALGLSPAAVREHRQAAEREVRQARLSSARQDAEVTLMEIHTALARRLALPDPDALAAAELAAERRLLCASPRVTAWLTDARRRGIRVMAISDTWYSASQVHALLAHVGIDIATDDIVTSADHRATKQQGTLFTIVQQHSGVADSAWVHIGDHPISDEQVPRGRGITTVLHPYKGAHAAPEPAPSLGDSARQGLAAGALLQERSVAWRIGYRTLGPLMLGFAQWIGEQARRHDAARVIFLLRDGLLFERICRVAGVLPDGIEVRTMPASRRAALLPALLSDPRWTLPQLLAGVGHRPIREYLERLGVPAQPHAAALARAGVPDLDQRVDARLPADHALVQRLFTAPEVLTALTAIATRERDALLVALAQAGLRETSPSLLVDLGWNATIQKALHRVVRASDRHDPNWRGCYLATWPGVLAGAPSGMHTDGFVCQAGSPPELMQALAVGRELLEVLCSSFDGSLSHFRGRNAEPVLMPYEFEPAHAAIVREVHDGAADYAADHGRVVQGADGTLTVVAALRDWTRLTHRPTHDEAMVLGALSHSDNVGSQTSRRIAQFRATADDVAGLIQDHEQAYWKQGLLGQRTPQGAALSGILWFADSGLFG